jgi:hypothetical protein
MRVKFYCEAWKERQPFRIIEVKLFPKVGEIIELGRRERVEVLAVERVDSDRRLDGIARVKEVN